MNRNKISSDLEELKFKLIVIGDELVGKTAILNRFKYNQFNGIYEPTVGLEFPVDEGFFFGGKMNFTFGA